MKKEGGQQLEVAVDILRGFKCFGVEFRVVFRDEVGKEDIFHPMPTLFHRVQLWRVRRKVFKENPPSNYRGPKLFADFNRAHTSEKYVEKFPYVITEQVDIKNLTIQSGLPYHISTNPFMFRNVKVNR